MLMNIPVNTLMTMPVNLLMKIPAKMKLVTCNNKQSVNNTMMNMMIKDYAKQYTDQPMSHIMKTARNFCCHKVLICLVKTFLNYYLTHSQRACAIGSMRALNMDGPKIPFQ